MDVLSRACVPTWPWKRLQFSAAAEALGRDRRKGVDWYSAVHLVADVMKAEGVGFFWQRHESW
jgi:hypothetical protein